jgi:hypothetical protein
MQSKLPLTSRIRRLITCGVSVPIAAAALLTASAAPATAQGTHCGQAGGHHWAGQHTSHTYSFDHCANPNDWYRGWAAVNGQLQTPTTASPSGSYLSDHTAGYLASNFNTAPYTYQAQTGWFIGSIWLGASSSPCLVGICVQRAGSYGGYFEAQDTTGYIVIDLGTRSMGSLYTSRVAYNSVDNCWSIYQTYSGLEEWQVCGVGTSGGMAAQAETDSTSGAAVGMGLNRMGASDPSSNQALRLKGAGIYEPWDTNLTGTLDTHAYDERLSTPGYWYSPFNPHYYFQTYS